MPPSRSDFESERDSYMQSKKEVPPAAHVADGTSFFKLCHAQGQNHLNITQIPCTAVFLLSE